LAAQRTRVHKIRGETLAERISGLGELSQFAAKLQAPADTVLDVFPEQPPKDLLHIIVQKPLGESYVVFFVVICPRERCSLVHFSNLT
jgi:hypothetical protein